jgi:hypothetical protein
MSVFPKADQRSLALIKPNYISSLSVPDVKSNDISILIEENLSFLSKAIASQLGFTAPNGGEA